MALVLHGTTFHGMVDRLCPYKERPELIQGQWFSSHLRRASHSMALVCNFSFETTGLPAGRKSTLFPFIYLEDKMFFICMELTTMPSPAISEQTPKEKKHIPRSSWKKHLIVRFVGKGRSGDQADSLVVPVTPPLLPSLHLNPFSQEKSEGFLNHNVPMVPTYKSKDLIVTSKSSLIWRSSRKQKLNHNVENDFWERNPKC